MADITTLRRSSLAHLHTQLAVGSTTLVSLTEQPFRTMVAVRVDPQDPAARRVGDVLGADLPVTCGQVAIGMTTVPGRGDPVASLWCGPDEWLVTSTDQAPAHDDLVPALQAALASAPGAVVDVSANRTTLELTGSVSRAVLEKGCPLDLGPSAFGPGTAVLTTVGSIPVVLWHVEEGCYRLLPRASFADYVARWLLDAMGEYRSPLVP